MLVGVFATKEEASAFAAKHVASTITAAENPVLGVATGSTPLDLYRELRQAHADGTFTLENAKAVALDEYVGIAEDHVERYRNVLSAELVGADKTGLADERLYTPDGSAADPFEAASQYDKAIKSTGGVSIQILGLGSDGHIAFNEPSGSFVSRTHVEALTRQTREDNSRFFDNDINNVPSLAITQGLGTIMEAQRIILLAFGENKADAVRELVEGPISAAWPATILQMHANVIVVTDEAAASKLELKDFYNDRLAALYRS